jgi:hypothetical protein
MTRINGFGTALLCLGLSIGCGGGDRDAANIEDDGTIAANTSTAQEDQDESTGRPRRSR